jgi:alkylation response protein AidB-like acyl-CoA dehydrogenase
MDFELTANQRTIYEKVKRFSLDRLNDQVFDDDDRARFPREKWDACGAFGVLGLPVPEAYGGQGQDLLTTALAIRGLAYGCRDEGLVFSLCAHLCTFLVPLMEFGTEAQKRRYLPAATSGELIGGNGITESEAGSDNSMMRTTVRRQGAGYVLDGQKLFVTNGPVADALVIYARHPEGMRPANISAFVVEKSRFQVGQHFQKMGLRTSPLSEILLCECALGPEFLVGRERLGMLAFNASMLWERIIMSAYHLGAMERQYETAADYARQRTQFGARIIRYQHIADKLVQMKLSIELARLLLLETCWKAGRGEVEMADAAMLKLYVSEARKKNSLEAVNIFGGYGYLKESIVEKDLRDSIASTIYSGTSEIQKNIIAEQLRGRE